MKKALLLCLALSLGGAFAQDFVMGITFDAGGKFDGSFNEGTWRGMVQAIDELEGEYEIELLEFEGTPDTAAEGQRRIAAQGAELIVAPGFLQADAVAATSREFPTTNFVLIDAVVERTTSAASCSRSRRARTWWATSRARSARPASWASSAAWTSR
jgi:basic membrane protein A